MNLRTLIKKPLNAVGLDLVRFRPQYSLGEYAYLQTLGIKTVLDVGAHHGEFSQMIATLLPGARILAFEPVLESFNQLTEATGNQPNIKAHNYALGDYNGTGEINRNEYSQSSSIRPMLDLHRSAFPGTSITEPETITIKRMDDVVGEMDITPGVLVKIDVQGYEDQVISGGRSTLGKAAAVIVEVSFESLYEGQPLFDNVYSSLLELGFRYSGNLYQLLNPTNGAVLQADALFQRKA